MSMSGTIAVSPSSVIINQPINCSLTVTNSGASDVNITAVTPIATITGSSPTDYMEACALGVVNLGPGAVTTVAASGTLAVGFSAVFFAPSTGPIGAGTGTFSIGALVACSDGSNFSATAATATVNPISLPATEQ